MLALPLVTSLGVAVPAVAAVPAAAASSATVTVVAQGLDNPRHLVIAPGDALYVAEAGHGGTGPCAGGGEGGNQECVGRSGGVVRIVNGQVTRVVTGLSSAAAPGGVGATGPADVFVSGRGYATLVQDELINAKGVNPFGPKGNDLGRLVATVGGRNLPSTDFAAYEAAHNPDHGRPGPPDPEPAIDSDPYGMTRYNGGIAVADAAANDLLWVDRNGHIHLLAVFPVIHETIDGHPGATQAVPTDVVVGPDNALYVTELTGYPFTPGSSTVYRVVPGHAPTVYASGLTNVVAAAFDHQDRLVVVEIAKNGLSSNDPTGALVRVNRDGTHTVITDRLIYPTGVAVAGDGSFFVSNQGIAPASGVDFGGHRLTGEVVRVTPANNS